MSLEHKLTIRPADPTAEIAVYDASFNRVGRDVGYYQNMHRDGLYEIRVRAGSGVEEKFISLAKDEYVDFEPVTLVSSIPLVQTTTTNETHQGAVERASQNPVVLGQGSGLLLAIRDRLGQVNQAPVASGSPASGLFLIGPDGARVFDLSQKASVDTSGHAPVATVFLHVNPGIYRLRLDLPDNTARERTLVASPGWTLQCFLVRRPVREGSVADLAQGSLSLNRLGKPFSAYDTRIRLSEAARDALANNRKVTDAAANALMNEKFEDPMLGLLVAHLLLRDTPEDLRLRVVLDNLVRLLGEDHPDVRAIALGPPLEGSTRPMTEMPMFRAGWDRVISRTVTKPDLIPADSPAGKVAARILPSAPWLIWESADTLSTRRNDFKMETLQNHVNRSAESRRFGVTRALFPPAASSLDLENQGLLPPGLEGGQEEPTPSLASEDREELMRSLGVPSSVLDDMLSRLGR